MSELIYILENDESINEFICSTLNYSGFKTESFYDSVSFYKKVVDERPSLILSEVVLSETEDNMGLKVVEELKANSATKDIPIIFLTSKTGELDKVRGLNLGADDYITKPFGVLELTARVMAVLRRYNEISAPKFKTGAINPQNGLHINLEARQVVVDNRKIPNLTFKEYELLLYLYEHMDAAVSRAKLLDDIWGDDFCGVYRTVDVHIQTLRHKLGDNAENPRFIQTVRGHGYKFIGNN